MDFENCTYDNYIITNINFSNGCKRDKISSTQVVPYNMPELLDYLLIFYIGR